MATESISIYASGVGMVAESSDQIYVTLKGIDVDNIVAEFPAEEVLGALRLSDIQDYLTERLADDE